MWSLKHLAHWCIERRRVVQVEAGNGLQLQLEPLGKLLCISGKNEGLLEGSPSTQKLHGSMELAGDGPC